MRNSLANMKVRKEEREELLHVRGTGCFSAAHGDDHCGAHVNTTACGGTQSKWIFAHGTAACGGELMLEQVPLLHELWSMEDPLWNRFILDDSSLWRGPVLE